ncbi:hypothetical protein POM88_010932 [Heracleum sosnowskyi]|uniref:Replication factor A C-terminal domain-containing protein n=1 Tax=Heracleum sosnowskyi TaxID=360622 RepID=A0AAD8N0T9_9APIA|nr:hypothetical protein POM88_010932 [Heracleum sosnowskyi]
MYKIIVRVKDQSGNTTFALFNKEVGRLPVEKVISEISQDNPFSRIPVVLNNVIGKICAFDMKINHFNINLGHEEYTVVKLSESELAANEVGVDNNEMTAKRPRIA